MKYILLFFSILFTGLLTGTQAQIFVYGRAFDSTSQQPIAMATITNLNKGRTVVTDYNGRFKIMAEPGNMLVASYTGYRLDTLRVVQLNIHDTLQLDMRILGELLPEAIITTKSRYNQYQLDSMKRRMEYADVLDRSDMPLIGGPAEGSGFGISLNLGRGSKKQKDTRRFKSQFELMEEQAYVSYIFAPQKVGEITGMQGDQLVNFMNLYRPGYDWVRKHQSDEELLEYVNSKMKDYRKKGHLN